MDYLSILKKIEQNDLKFSRWGDGEWNCMFPLFSKKTNTDGHQYFKSLGNELREVLARQKENQTYTLGLQNHAVFYFVDKISKYQIKWINADVFHNASIARKFNTDFVKDCVMVGNKSLEKLKPYELIEVPLKDAYLVMDEVKDKIKTDRPVILCCGMMANLLVDYLPQSCVVDMGSVFDPYVGRKTRTYHHSL